MLRVFNRYRTPGPGAVATGLLILYTGCFGPLAPTPARSGEPPHPAARPAGDGLTWIEAIRRTQTTGTPTVLVVTSAAVPASKIYARSLCQHPTTARLRSQFGVAELAVDEEPEQAKRLGVSTYPTLVAYRRGQGGRLEPAGVYRGGLSVEALTGWLLGLGLAQGGADYPATAATTAAPVPAASRDPQVQRTQYPYPAPPVPSPQQPMYYPPPVPKVVPPAPAPAPRVVYRKVAPRKQVVTRRVRVAPREVEVVEVPRRRVVREVESPAPRNLLTQPREAEGEVVEVREVEEAAPREAEEVVEVREVEAPREVVEVREVEAPAPREVIRVREVEVPAARAVAQPAQVALVQPGVFDRFLGAIGRGLATRANPRVAVESRQEMVTLAAAPRAVAIAAPREAAPCQHGRHCRSCGAEPAPYPPPIYTPAPYPYPPAYPPMPPNAPSPQSPH